MTSILLWLTLLSPCQSAVPIDSGQVAPCTGILVTVDQAKKAIANREELKIRKVFECPECPKCPTCPPPPAVNEWSWAVGGIIAGALISAILGITLNSAR